MKRISIIFIILFAFANFVFAGGEKETTRKEEMARAPETILTWWAPISETDRREAYLSVMKKYTEQVPQVAVKFNHVDDLPEKLKFAVPGGVGPDFIRWAHDRVGEFKILDLIVPIEDYISPEFKSRIPESVWNAVSMDGHIWGIPETTESVALLYNEDMITNPPSTTDEMIAIMKNYHDPSKTRYGLSYPINVYSVAAFVHAFDGYYYDDRTDKCGLNSQGTIEGIRFLVEKIKPYMLQDIDYGVQTALFTEGKAPLSINGPWYFSVADEGGLNWELAKLPTIPGVGPLKPFMGVQAFMITRNCKDIKSAVEFLEWITSPPIAVDLAMVTGNLPANSDALLDSRIKNDPVKSILAEQVRDAIPMSKKPEMGPVWGRGYEALNAIWAGTKSINTALKEAQELVEKDIKEMKK